MPSLTGRVEALDALRVDGPGRGELPTGGRGGQGLGGRDAHDLLDQAQCAVVEGRGRVGGTRRVPDAQPVQDLGADQHQLLLLLPAWRRHTPPGGRSHLKGGHYLGGPTLEPLASNEWTACHDKGRRRKKKFQPCALIEKTVTVLGFGDSWFDIMRYAELRKYAEQTRKV